MQAGTLVRQARALLGVGFQEGIAYRASGLIWIMTDVATEVTMPMVWAAAARNGTIQGFGTSDFVLYYLCLLLLNGFITSHILWELAMEIKDGQFTTYLLRPTPIYLQYFCRNLSWRMIRPMLFLPIFLVLLAFYRPMIGTASLNLGPEFWLALASGHLVSFTFVMMMGMIALFTEEAMSIFELYYVPMLFLSGNLFPIAMLPDWARFIAKLMPFYYTSGLPTEILVGRVTGPMAWQGLLVQWVWIGLAFAGAHGLFRRGVRHYAGVGM
jgi:ABC-2 type transport system permease protein